MNKNAIMEKLARDAYEKGGFNGVWHEGFRDLPYPQGRHSF